MEKSLSVVVPAYNEEKNIEATIKEILKAGEQLEDSFEIVIVDDCSSDRTAEIVNTYALDDSRIKYFKTPKNLGFGGAYKLGVKNSTLNYVIMVCGDDCIGYESLGEIFSHTGKSDLVIPYTGNPETRSYIRRFLSWAFVKILNILFQNSVQYYNGHNIVPTKDVQAMDYPDDFSYAATILVELLDRGYTYAECPMIIKVRQEGKTKAFKVSNVINVVKSLVKLVGKTYSRRLMGPKTSNVSK